jgi:hypothetical protein
MSVRLQSPDARLDYAVDWAAELGEGETIAASRWRARPRGLLAGNGGISGARTAVWVSGGRAGRVYRLTNTITTSAGRRHERTIVLRCEQL